MPSWKEKASQLKSEVYAVFLACRDPRVPWHAKALMALVIGYAVTPIDLIPDFIPVLGQLDDLIIVPAGISVVAKMIPKEVMEECRQKAKTEPMDSRMKYAVAAIIVLIWIVAIYLVLRFVWPFIF